LRLNSILFFISYFTLDFLLDHTSPLIRMFTSYAWKNTSSSSTNSIEEVILDK